MMVYVGDKFKILAIDIVLEGKHVDGKSSWKDRWVRKFDVEKFFSNFLLIIYKL